MTLWFFKRILLSLPVIFTVSTLVFFLVHLIPGDPVDFMVGENAALDQKEVIRAQYHLDEPILRQYQLFIGDLLRGDLKSMHSGEPVWDVLKEKFPQTLKLAAAALLVAVLFSIPAGTLAAWKQYSWWDTAAMGGALVGISMPNFWLGPLLILVFSMHLGWFPVSGGEAPGSLVLPAVTLGLGLSAILTRMTRGAVLEVIRQDYITAARARGLPEWRVLVGHALRNALLPIVTVLGLQFGSLLAGSIITEEVFGWPGVGREVVSAIQTRDFPMIQACVLMIATTYVIVNTVTDVLYAAVNPRIRLSGGP